MKLAALTLIGLGLIGAAEAQVQTNPAQVNDYLPVPDLLPGLRIDTGMSAIDAVMFSDSMRGSVRDPSQAPLPLAPVAGAEPGIETIITPDSGQLVSPEAVAVQDPTALVPGVQDPTALVPGAPDATASLGEEAPAPPKPQQDSITVIVEGVESSQGTINVGVCDTGLSREGCPYHTEVKASAGFVEAHFDGIPPGRYAVVGYHDVNGNSEHDKFLGVPKEPYALSSKAGSKMIPTFNDAAVKIEKGENTVIIKMRRFGS